MESLDFGSRFIMKNVFCDFCYLHVFVVFEYNN